VSGQHELQGHLLHGQHEHWVKLLHGTVVQGRVKVVSRLSNFVRMFIKYVFSEKMQILGPRCLVGPFGPKSLSRFLKNVNV